MDIYTGLNMYIDDKYQIEQIKTYLLNSDFVYIDDWIVIFELAEDDCKDPICIIIIYLDQNGDRKIEVKDLVDNSCKKYSNMKYHQNLNLGDIQSFKQIGYFTKYLPVINMQDFSLIYNNLNVDAMKY